MVEGSRAFVSPAFYAQEMKRRERLGLCRNCGAPSHEVVQDSLRLLVKGLETLALALADMNHCWPNEEHRAYERAMTAAKRLKLDGDAL